MGLAPHWQPCGVAIGDQARWQCQVAPGTFENGWRDRDDIAWRVTSWEKRRQLTGGLKLDALADEERKQLGLPEQALGLKVKHVGQFAPHDVAKRAGFKAGDVLIKFGAWDQPMTESQLLVALLRQANPGDTFAVEIARGEKRLTLELKLP